MSVDIASAMVQDSLSPPSQSNEASAPSSDAQSCPNASWSNRPAETDRDRERENRRKRQPRRHGFGLSSAECWAAARGGLGLPKRLLLILVRQLWLLQVCQQGPSRHLRRGPQDTHMMQPLHSPSSRGLPMARRPPVRLLRWLSRLWLRRIMDMGGVPSARGVVSCTGGVPGGRCMCGLPASCSWHKEPAAPTLCIRISMS